jgi:hypothetical protein
MREESCRPGNSFPGPGVRQKDTRAAHTDRGLRRESSETSSYFRAAGSPDQTFFRFYPILPESSAAELPFLAQTAKLAEPNGGRKY